MPTIDWQFNAVALPLLAAVLLAAGLIIYAYQKRQSAPAALPFIAVCITGGIWTLFYGLELITANLDGKMFWNNFQYLGIPTIGVAWLVFALAYTEQDRWLKWKFIAPLLIVPVITMLLVWTHSSHTLMYQAIRLDTDGPVPMVDLTYGLFFWVNAAHSYIVLIVGSALLIRQGWRSRQVYRWQAIITGLAAVIPLVGNVIYLGRLLPFPLDLTPIGFVIAMLIFGWSIFRYKLFDLIPVAYQKIVEKMPDLVVVLDASNRIVELNPVAARLLNVQPQGVIGRDVKSVFANWQAFVDQCLSLGDGRAEIKLERPNRDPLWFDVQMASLYGQAGRLQGKLGILRDITERKQNELALALARDEALSANQFKTQLLSNVSHDLRTPLSGIRGYTELLLLGAYGDLNETQRDSLDNINKNGQRLNELITELLDHARLESGKLTLKNGPVTPRELADKVSASMKILAEAKGISYTMEVDPELPTTLIGDDERLQQILQNLAGNAVKFTSHGSVKALLFKASANQWGMKVTDTGAGIPMDAQSSIFEPFSQLSQSSKEDRKGFGLGLSIVKQLATLMGGEIQVSSIVNQGSTFTVLLPLLTEPIAEPA